MYVMKKWNEESKDHRDALLYAMGVDKQDVDKPVIGIINSWNEMNPGHYHFKDIIGLLKDIITEQGALPRELPVLGICDGMCSNTPGDNYSLPARDLVSAEVETLAELNSLDGMLLLSSCDKIVPGQLMGVFRVNIPSVVLTGGYMKAGSYNGELITITHTKQAYAAYKEGRITRQEYKEIVKHACPGPGTCPLMGTANTMCTVSEVLGLSPPGNATVPANSTEWLQMAKEAAIKIVELVKADKKPRDHIKKANFENAMKVVMATGGSTNAILHIPAIANQAGINISIEEFDTLSRDIPVLCTIYPSHPTFTMDDYHKAGGVIAVCRELADKGQLNPNTEGFFKSMGERLKNAKNHNTEVIHKVENPIFKTGGIAVLHGNLATNNAIVKVSAVDPSVFKFIGPARVYESQDSAWKALMNNEIPAGSVVVIRYEGPKGSPGMPHLETFMSAVVGKKMETKLALITDGRFSGATAGLAVGHVSPEAYEGGNIGLIRDGDIIRIDIMNRSLILDVSDKELESRRKSLKLIEKPAYGWLEHYRKCCTSADKGATIFWKS
jgi:dihydroxy-acid dehydratase